MTGEADENESTTETTLGATVQQHAVNSATPKDVWDKMESLSRITAAIAIPAVIAVGGWYIQNTAAHEAIRKDYVTLAISILEKPTRKDDSGLRNWAVDLLSENAPTRFPVGTAAQLKSGSLILPSSTQLILYQTDRAAQAHCPSDEVVWLNTNSGIYHEKGTRWYGSTDAGAYVCRKEADAVGNRYSPNGR